MAIEDLFKIVKERFVAEQPAVPASQEGDVEIPQDLLFKCPRCGAVVYNREFTAAMPEVQLSRAPDMAGAPGAYRRQGQLRGA